MLATRTPTQDSHTHVVFLFCLISLSLVAGLRAYVVPVVVPQDDGMVLRFFYSASLHHNALR